MDNCMAEKYDSSGYLVKRLLGGYISKHYAKLIAAVLAMFIVAAATAAMAWIMQPIIDDIFLNKDNSKLMLISIGVIVIFAVKGFATYWQDYLMQCLGQRIITDMQIELYNHLLYSDLALINSESSGKIISRFTNDIGRLRASTIIVTTGLAKELLTLIVLVGVMFYQSFTLALIAFTAFPVAIYPLMRLGKKMRKISHRTQEQLGDFTVRLDETFKGARVIKAYRQEQFEINKAGSALEKIYQLFAKAARNQAMTSPMMETIGGLAVASVIWYGGSQVIEGTTTSGQFFSFITAVLAAYKPAKSLSGMNSNLQEGLAAAKRVFSLLDIKPVITEKANAIALPGKQHKISFENVVFSYDDNKTALNGISLEVHNGKTIALVGPSGGGKSTIMNLVLRFYDPSSGRIKIDNTDIRDITLTSLRDSIAFVSQDITLFDDTIAANIAYGKPDATEGEIKQAAILAAADEFITQLPNGYNSVIGQDGMTLSGGQRQRISIARAMLKNAPILLLDEATSALDPISEKKIQNAIEQLMKGRTTIVIAHRLSTVENSDLIYVIKNGTVVESGKHQELIEKQGEYSRLYRGLES
ncbi:MAG: msbA [Rickettsiaceae bacterium]|nr:msbA [Rickettsiaceae bacterium]